MKMTNIGVPGLNRYLRALPKEAQAELRDASVTIAADVATKAADKAASQGGAAAIVAPTIKATRDRVPVVKMGGTAKLPPRDGKPRTGRGQTVGNIIWGAEFGGQARPTTMQFRPHLGRIGYFLWPTVRGDSEHIQDEYSAALKRALDRA